jgi:ATP-dependent RNA helicase DDX31/DBP7
LNSFRWIVPGCLSGGEKRKSEKARIRKGISILIATPGRLLDHLSKTESLLMALKGKLEWLVMDEADRLLDMGLGGQVEQIVQHVRANQPGSGPKRDGVTWNSILLSATVTSRVEELAKKMLGGDKWLWARGGESKLDTDSAGDLDVTSKSDHSKGLQLGESTPRQLGQLHITVSAKLRLATLVAFLAQRVKRNERTVVFMSTCDGVDYHEALFQAMDSILPGDDDTPGIFGKSCPIFKLHGNVPHAERHRILQKFGQHAGSSQRAVLLLATDVAARGLNLPGVDWAVQYDPPCEVADYAHRAGRTARAGKAGHSLLFLLPSERQFLEVLEVTGLKGMTALSLTSTLNQAAKICVDLTDAGEKRSGGGYGQSMAGRSGESFCSEIQHRLEDCVMADDAKTKAAAAKELNASSRSGKRRKKGKMCGKLLEMAMNAFASYLRSYPTKEKAVRHIFSARALHLGHIARSFALKEPPKAMQKVNLRTDSPEEADGEKRKSSSLTFQDRDDEEHIIVGKRQKVSREHVTEKRVDNKEARALLHARATRLQQGGMDM